jgi:hypothetical protein
MAFKNNSLKEPADAFAFAVNMYYGDDVRTSKAMVGNLALLDNVMFRVFKGELITYMTLEYYEGLDAAWDYYQKTMVLQDVYPVGNLQESAELSIRTNPIWGNGKKDN